MALADLPKAKWLPGTGKQVILKEDFVDIEEAVLEVSASGGGSGSSSLPPLVWVDAATCKLEATPDCPVEVSFSGFPNIMNPAASVSGDLSDSKSRSITALTSCNFGVAANLWGSVEQPDQWYSILAIAGDSDTSFTLKAMPWLRVDTQSTRTIYFGTNTTPATGIGYGFTTDEFVGGMVYFFTGASKGLMRTIIANNDSTTAGTVTYSDSEDILSLIAGDWFIIMPPTNFKRLGEVYNNSSYHTTEIDDLIYGKPGPVAAVANGYWFAPFTWTTIRVNGSGGGGGGGTGTGGSSGGDAIFEQHTVVPGNRYLITGGAGGTGSGAGAGGSGSSSTIVGPEGTAVAIVGGAGGAATAGETMGRSNAWGYGGASGVAGGRGGGGGATANGGQGFIHIFRDR